MNAPDNGVLSAAFGKELAGVVLSEATLPGLLGIVVNLAVTRIPGVDGAGVSLVLRDGKHLQTTNPSSAAMGDTDGGQYRHGVGPGVEAVRTGQEVVVTLPVARWPAFSSAAGDLGFCSVWSLPLLVRAKTLGALNLYSTTEHTADGQALRAGRALAGQAAVVLANASTLMSAELANRHLLDALASRDVIGQAKGILMARHGLTADQAFEDLRWASQRHGRKLGDLAAEVVDAVAPRCRAADAPGDAA
jgi:hypothetical protein